MTKLIIDRGIENLEANAATIIPYFTIEERRESLSLIRLATEKAIEVIDKTSAKEIDSRVEELLACIDLSLEQSDFGKAEQAAKTLLAIVAPNSD